MDYAAIAGLLMQAGISGAGQAMAGMSDEEAKAFLERILAGYEGIDVPDMPSVSAQTLGRSAMGDVSADPELVAAQREVLARLGDYTDDGITAADRAEMARLGNASVRTASRAQSGIRDQLAARGLSNSGISYALQQQAGQDAGERAAQGALDLNAQAMRQRLSALAQSGDLAGSMRSRDFDERSRAATARDEIERYNAAAKERANAYNAGLPGQRFGMQMQRQGGITGALSALSGNSSQAAQGTRDFTSGLGQSAYHAMRGQGSYGYTQPTPQRMTEDEWRRYYDTHGTPPPPRY